MKFDFIRLKNGTETIRIEHDGGVLYTEPIFYTELVKYEQEPRRQQMQLAAFASIAPGCTLYNANECRMQIKEDDLRDAKIIASYDTETPDVELEKLMKYKADVVYNPGTKWIDQFTM